MEIELELPTRTELKYLALVRLPGEHDQHGFFVRRNELTDFRAFAREAALNGCAIPWLHIVGYTRSAMGKAAWLHTVAEAVRAAQQRRAVPGGKNR